MEDIVKSHFLSFFENDLLNKSKTAKQLRRIEEPCNTRLQ
ncbi:hypothetical protein HMPREF1586_00429 [Gardnerella vaginalis JCP8522]|nr:hypothetical protein HMPREF1586_00429 [Gardnerella vaginalis JCP8522]